MATSNGEINKDITKLMDLCDIFQKEKGDSQKDKKRKSSKDRSRAYEYSYDTTYLGGGSRHASLENVQHAYGYRYTTAHAARATSTITS